MKKIIAFLCIMIMILTTIFSTGCSHYRMNSGASTAKNTLKELVTAFENNDKKAVKELFSRNILKKYENFDNDLNKAFSYFNDNMKSKKYTYEESVSAAEINYGDMVLFCDYDINVADGKTHYILSAQVCTDDDEYKDNMGVWSVCLYEYIEQEFDEEDFGEEYEDDEDIEDDEDDDIRQREYGIFTYSSDINDYAIIKDDNIPLSIEKLDNESFELLLSDYKGSSRQSSDVLRLSYVARVYGIGSLREVEVNGEKVYYCIYSNKADSKRQYLFIGYIGADLYTWSCEEDVCINSKTSDTSHEKNIYYKLVKECDKY